ncbi:hypothetical protein BGZ94_003393, partial [Podila epigama]
ISVPYMITFLQKLGGPIMKKPAVKELTSAQTMPRSAPSIVARMKRNTGAQFNPNEKQSSFALDQSGTRIPLQLPPSSKLFSSLLSSSSSSSSSSSPSLSSSSLSTTATEPRPHLTSVYNTKANTSSKSDTLSSKSKATATLFSTFKSVSVQPPTSKHRLSSTSPTSVDPLSSPPKSQALGVGTFPLASLTKIRVGRKEFTEPDMTVQFAPDRIIIIIGTNTTKIAHKDIKVVDFYTDSDPSLLQITTEGKLDESSVLSPYYDPTPSSVKSRRITLYSNSEKFILLDFCSKLRSKRASVKPMSVNRSKLPTSDTQDEVTAKSKSIAVRQQDASRLDDDEFLNDTLIEFGLNGSSVHWFLAIITNPHLLLRDDDASSSNSNSPVASSPDITPAEKLESALDSDAVHPPSPTRPSAQSPRQESQPSSPNSIMHSLLRARSLANPRRSTRNAPLVPIDVEDKTIILCMDSLGGTHASVFKALRSYLQQELQARKGLSKELKTKQILARYATKAPKQENFCDCGLYLLHYADMFTRHPTEIADSIVNKSDGDQYWDLDALPNKRQSYREIVHDLTLQYQEYLSEQDNS